MDKKVIKTFAIESRKKLIDEIKYQASLLGITEDRIDNPVEKAEAMEVYDIGAATPNTIYDDAIKQRESLVKRINEKSFDNVIEEAAYTWFNRIIAIRFMEVNNYLPTRIRVLSSETRGKFEPDIVTESPNIDLNFSDGEIKQIYKLKNDNKLDELFRFLFIKQCNKLNEILPELFEKTADYTELLLSISFTNEEGVVRQLIDNISEEDFKDQVEIIGWLYQYYNTELKDDTFKQVKKRLKITKERIPAVTQLFTPDWIVRYMVENSLGRLWLEGHPDSDLKENWKYYLDESEQEPEVQIELSKIREDSKTLKPEDIKIIDPAMGSGHILVYAFDILMQIYISLGYSEKDAAVSILENNLYGLDLDDRAYQLAYFAVMMKGRSYNLRILNKNIDPQICSIQESKGISDELIDFISVHNSNIKKDLTYLVKIFVDAKEFGSIIDLKQINYNSIFNVLMKIKETHYSDFKSIKSQIEVFDLIYPILKQSFILSMKYDIVVSNPPYMGNNSMNRTLSAYLKKNFPDSKADMYAVFIEKCQSLVAKNRYLAMITQHSFMFLSTYSKLREKILEQNIVNMIHLGARAFEEIGGEVVQTTSFIIQNCFINHYESKYSRLVDYNSQKTKEQAFFNENNIYLAKQVEFTRIPGNPISYWITNNVKEIFNKAIPLKQIETPVIGVASHKDHYFLRLWYEVDYNKIGFQMENSIEAFNSKKKWFPYNKGGKFRRWYGNNEYLVNYEKDGYELKNFKQAQTKNKHKYFWKGMTWSRISTNQFSVRYHGNGFIMGDAGPSAFAPDEILYYILGLLNTPIIQIVLSAINPTLNYQVGNISEIPIILIDNHEKIDRMVKENIKIARDDWDSFETSWDFKQHPLLRFNENTLESAYDAWKSFKEKEFLKLKSNEVELNRLFIDIYNVKNDISPDVEDRYVSLNHADYLKDVKSFISYAVGCMFGRFSLNEKGLVYAGGNFETSKYKIFLPDDDNIIPILDSEYFDDDIVGQFVEFVKLTYDEKKLEENLDFIAKALKNKGNTSREIIRNYFLTDFYKDHCNSYSGRVTGKCPIYWQFDSGKENGFKALIYIHRYEQNLVAKIRTDYLHKTQKALDNAIIHNERTIENSKNATEKSNAVKAKNRLFNQLEEIKKYDEALAHLANQKIEINLDEGVKANYAKFQDVEVSKEGKKTIKINLLKKI